MKRFLIALSIVSTVLISAQKFSSKTGRVNFEASIALFEDINATDNNNVLILNADSGDIASVSVVKNYKFKVKLMEEHFNENYAESEKYPKVTFKGKVLDFNKSKLSNAPQKYTLQGNLNFHGVDKIINSPAIISLKEGKIYIKGSFVVRPIDFKIKIPRIVSKKIAETVKIEYNYILSQ